HERIDPDVRAHAHAVGDAQKDQGAEEVHRQLQRPHEAVVEDVAGHDLGEGHDGHGRQEKGNQALLDVFQPDSRHENSFFQDTKRPPCGGRTIDMEDQPAFEALALAIRSSPIWPENFAQTGRTASRQAAISRLDRAWILALPASAMRWRSRSLISAASLLACSVAPAMAFCSPARMSSGRPSHQPELVITM